VEPVGVFDPDAVLEADDRLLKKTEVAGKGVGWKM
jgi:hypothetical protein